MDANLKQIFSKMHLWEFLFIRNNKFFLCSEKINRVIKFHSWKRLSRWPCSLFPNKESEMQRSKLICPRYLSLLEVGLELESRFSRPFQLGSRTLT